MNLQLLHELQQGKSECGNFWIKHPYISDEAYLERLNSKFLNIAVKRKIPLEKEAIIIAQKAGTWTEDDEKSLESSTVYSLRLKENYDKIIEVQKKYIEEDLNKSLIEVAKLRQKKNFAISRTAEDWANKLASERYSLSLFFKDIDLKTRAWEDDEMEMLENKDVDFFMMSFFEHRKSFSFESLKALACSGFCQNLYSTAGDPFLFFGKSILEITCFQQRFMSFLGYYKSIIEQISGKVSNEMLSDWEQLEKWAKATETGREEFERNSKSFKGDNKINFDNIRKASMVKGEGEERKAVLELLS